ncbi:MAG: FMN reductase [Streptosporangiales bacterium]|nr:FMN reductase [Streptosporangiales bacterium]
MTNVLAISGSLRTGSFNSMLIEAARERVPSGMSIEVYEGLRDIPPYDSGIDTEAPPPPVADLRARIAAADGLLIATPEYNYGAPGVLKNALDWASTPPWASVLQGKPVALMGASPTPFGTVRAQLALRQVFLWTGSPVVTKPEVLVFSAYERFDADGRLTDEGTAELVSGLLAALDAEILALLPVAV